MAYMLYGISVAPTIASETTYDPFQVLGISGSATEKQIKKHYKKLSLQLSVHYFVMIAAVTDNVAIPTRSNLPITRLKKKPNRNMST